MKKIALKASFHDAAQQAAELLRQHYDFVDDDMADACVVLGGDGFMLETMHNLIQSKRMMPLYGMNQGTIGFLMNGYQPYGLLERVGSAKQIHLHPLEMRCQPMDGDAVTHLAFNEVTLFRQTRLSCKIKIFVDQRMCLEELIGDGVILATSAGSTAYNLSAHGPIVPLGSGLLALTPINAFRPRRWRGALLPHPKNIHFEILQPDARRVNATADHAEIIGVRSLTVKENRHITMTLLFDQGHDLEERIIMEQFIP